MIDRLEGSQSGTDELSSAGEAGHEMGLDQAGGDLQVGFDVAAVDPGGDAAGAMADQDVFAENLAVMVLDAVVVGDEAADHFDEFFPFVGAMQAGGDQDQDLLTRNAGIFEGGQQGGQQEGVGDGTGDIADDDTRVASAFGELGQWWGANWPS